MKTRCLAGVCSAFFMLVGCSASPLPDANYYNFGNFIGSAQKCFENGHLEAQMYAETKTAFSYVLSTWAYDYNRLSNIAENAYNAFSASESSCKNVQVSAYQLIAESKQHKVDAKEGEEAFNEALQNLNKNTNQNKPVFCNTFGTTTVCN